MYFVILIFAVLGATISHARAECRPPSQTTVHENQRLTRVLHHQAKMWQVSPSLSPNSAIGVASRIQVGPQVRSFSLLEIVNEVAKAACPDRFVSHDFTLDGALKMFSILRSEVYGTSDLFNGYFSDIVSASVYQRILPILVSCQRKILSENLKFASDLSDDHCSNGVIRRICYDRENIFMCKDLRPRNISKSATTSCQNVNANLILDVVWNVVDLVHGLCLQDFRDENDLTAFHLWEQAMEGLFPKKILDYWYKSDLSTEQYQFILHPNAIQQLYNLEMCVEGIYYLTSHFRIPRLARPTLPERKFLK